MTWLTWRLHRTEAAIGILLFAGLMAIMLLGIQSVNSAYDAVRAEGCSPTNQSILCSERENAFFVRSGRWNNLTELLHGVPLVVAVLLAIPTLQELERGTHRLAWTQSISRKRWTLSRLGFAGGIAALVAVIWIVMAMEWRSSLLRGPARSFERNTFDLSPGVLLGYALFAAALALALAVAVRRVVPVLALTAVGFLGARIVTTFVLRPHYRRPIEETVSAANESGQFTAFENRWILDESWVSRTGQRLSWERVYQLCTPGGSEQTSDAAYHRCLVDNGLYYFRAFQPTDRVGQFQLIETALYLSVAAGLFVFAYWWLTRRPA